MPSKLPPGIVCLSLAVVRNGGANQVLKRGRVNLVAFAEIDGARGLRVRAGIEKSLRIVERSALEEVELYMVLEGAGTANQAVVAPHGGAPLPFLSDAWDGLANQLAQSSVDRAAPVVEFRNLLGDQLRRVRS